MKAIPYLFILLVALSMMAGCMPRVNDEKPEAYPPVLYADTITGCEYLATGNPYSLTPRIAADGRTHKGCGGAK